MHVCSTLWPVSNRLWFAGCLQRVLVSLVKRLMDMRIVRFCRTKDDVLVCLGSESLLLSALVRRECVALGCNTFRSQVSRHYYGRNFFQS